MTTIIRIGNDVYTDQRVGVSNCTRRTHHTKEIGKIFLSPKKFFVVAFTGIVPYANEQPDVNMILSKLEELYIELVACGDFSKRDFLKNIKSKYKGAWDDIKFSTRFSVLMMNKNITVELYIENGRAQVACFNHNRPIGTGSGMNYIDMERLYSDTIENILHTITLSDPNSGPEFDHINIAKVG